MACGPPGSSVRGDSPGRKTVISSSREFPDPGIKPASLYFNVSCTGRRIPYPLGQEGNGLPPGEGNDHPLQCSCLENSKDRGAWWATVHAVAESDTTGQPALAYLGPLRKPLNATEDPKRRLEKTKNCRIPGWKDPGLQRYQSSLK